MVFVPTQVCIFTLSDSILISSEWGFWLIVLIIAILLAAVVGLVVVICCCCCCRGCGRRKDTNNIIQLPANYPMHQIL